MDKYMKKKDNRGMSLVEIILVIALMSIIAGMTGYGLNLISKKPVQECAKKVEIALNQNRTNSMGKKVAYLVFYMTDDGRVAFREYSQSARESTVREGEQIIIGAAGIKLSFVYKKAGESDSEKLLGTDHDHIRVSFRRDSGSLEEETDGGVLDRIEIYKDEAYIETVSIDKLTGKVKLQ